jgi:hypothetical protein
MPLKLIYNKNLGCVEQKMYFCTIQKIKKIRNILIDIIFVMKLFSDDLFRAAHYRLMLVLNKDALFHFINGNISIFKQWIGYYFTTFDYKQNEKTLSETIFQRKAQT